MIPGFQSSLHFHKKKCETFFVTRGSLHLELYRLLPVAEKQDVFDARFDERLIEIGSKENLILTSHVGAITIDPLIVHRFSSGNSEIAEFIETSTPDELSDSYRLTLSGAIHK